MMLHHPWMTRVCAGLLASTALASCAPQLQYDVPGSIALDVPSRDVAREANSMLERYYATRGDFQPNDLIRLSFPYFPILNSDQRVQLSGFISPPLLNPVQTKGVSVAQLQADLTRAYHSKLERPAVSISILEYNNPPPLPEVFVMGEVNKPGSLPYRDSTTLIEALARAGGANRQADLGQVVLLTPQESEMTARLVDLNGILNGNGQSIGYLSPYSIIIVPPTRLARISDKATQIRRIIGFNGVNIGTNLAVFE